MDSHSTMTDRALMEEVARYGYDSISWGLRVSGSSVPNSFYFGRAPKREYYDHSGVLREDIQEGKLVSILDADGHAEVGNGCWHLVEVNCIGDSARDLEWGSIQSEPQEVRGEKDVNWEESSLAKFNHFLGFSTVGLEKEILSFLIKIRKRRERIHSKGLLEKSKFDKGSLRGWSVQLTMRGNLRRNVLFRAEGASQRLSNESKNLELECEGSE